MSARIVVMGLMVAVTAVPAAGANRGPGWRQEEARLRARVHAQRLRIRALEAQLTSLTVAAPPPPEPRGDTHHQVDGHGLRVGLSARDLRSVRGTPNSVARAVNGTELWSYGSLRITVRNGRVTGWQRIPLPSRDAPPPPAPSIGPRVLPPVLDPVPDDTPVEPPPSP